MAVSGLLLANIVMVMVNVILALVLVRLVMVGRRFNAALADYVGGHVAGDDPLARAIPPEMPSRRQAGSSQSIGTAMMPGLYASYLDGSGRL